MNLAKLLVREGMVSAAQVKESIESGTDAGYGVTESLVALGYVTERQIVEFLSREYGVPAMDIDGCEADESLLGLVPGETALEKFLVPVSLEGADLTIAVSDPSNILLLDDLGFITGKNIKPVIASERSIREKLSKYYGAGDAAVSTPDEEGSFDSGSAGGPAADSLHSSGINSPVEDVIRELEQYERELSSPPYPASGAKANSGADDLSGEDPADESQPVQLHEVIGNGQTNQDNYVFDLTKEISPSPRLPLSPSEDGKDSPEPDGKETADVNVRNEEENPGESTAPSSGGYTIQEEKEEKPQSAPPVEDRKPPGPDMTMDGTGRTVLIVDVSPTVRKIMTMTLERAGYRVYAAGDGMQALARINEAIPDLVFVDIKLPHMDGYQLCKVIKSHGLTKSVPVILVSGKTGVLDKMKVRMAGASDLITKPFSAGALVEAAGKFAVRSQLTQ
jgi:CheY-like chemotaxis protein